MTSPSKDTGRVEQPEFHFFECGVCGFNSVQRADFSGSELCPLCAEDCGHDNRMSRRVATTADKPEGKDARAALSRIKTEG